MSRSPFFYVGDKYKLVPQLKELFPKTINTLIEPFCGGGSVFLNIQANKYIENDNNPWMIKLHKFLISNSQKRKKFFDRIFNLIKEYGFSASYLGIAVPDELKKKHVKTYYAVYNKNAYSRLKQDFNKDKTDLYRLYLLLIYGFNHMLRFNGSGDFNLPVGNVDFNKNVYNALNDYFDFGALNQPNFICKDFSDFINNLDFLCDEFVYLDPPYLITFSEYNKLWTVEEEKKLYNLLDSLNEKGIRFGITNLLKHKGKTNELFRDFSNKYKSVIIKSNYISFNDNTIKDESVELYVFNY